MEKEIQSLRAQVLTTVTQRDSFLLMNFDVLFLERRARFRPSIPLEDLRNATKRGGRGDGCRDGCPSRLPIRDCVNGKDHPSHAATGGDLDIGRRRRRQCTVAIAAKAATVTDAKQSGGGVDRNAVDRGAQHKLRPGDTGCFGAGGGSAC